MNNLGHPDFETLHRIVTDAWTVHNETPKILHNVEVLKALDDVLHWLDQGVLRVSEKAKDGQWICHQWIKQAILLYFKTHPNQFEKLGINRSFDKIPLKWQNWEQQDFEVAGFRVLPGAIVRRGAHIAKDVVLMPSFINIGAYVGEGTMIDTWATIGSCAQIGSNCHISGGVGIGGVLEPIQANPTIIEDHCFIGARSEIAEGVVVEEGCVISMGVFISASTKIFNRETGQIIYGRVPSGSVVVPGSIASHPKDRSIPTDSESKDIPNFHLSCAVIVKKVDGKTLSKTGLNNLLREIR